MEKALAAVMTALCACTVGECLAIMLPNGHQVLVYFLIMWFSGETFMTLFRK